jgi:hypothetical protein
MVMEQLGEKGHMHKVNRCAYLLVRVEGGGGGWREFQLLLERNFR